MSVEFPWLDKERGKLEAKPGSDWEFVIELAGQIADAQYLEEELDEIEDDSPAGTIVPVRLFDFLTHSRHLDIIRQLLNVFGIPMESPDVHDYFVALKQEVSKKRTSYRLVIDNSSIDNPLRPGLKVTFDARGSLYSRFGDIGGAFPVDNDQMSSASKIIDDLNSDIMESGREKLIVRLLNSLNNTRNHDHQPLTMAQGIKAILG